MEKQKNLKYSVPL